MNFINVDIVKGEYHGSPPSTRLILYELSCKICLIRYPHRILELRPCCRERLEREWVHLRLSIFEICRGYKRPRGLHVREAQDQRSIHVETFFLIEICEGLE